jgi:hypothetical protein
MIDLDENKRELQELKKRFLELLNSIRQKGRIRRKA